MEKKFYDHQNIEAKWKERWEKEKLYQIDPAASDDTYYCLDMFPYPSGLGLHVGHWRGYVLSDYYARYQRLHGKNVLHPMGLDSFGLPAERAAIKDKTSPKKYTDEAAKRFIPELKMIGSSFDWSKYLSTCEPNYYQWTQWLFVQLFQRGLAEKRLSLVNWCPNDQTVLANEQVINGCCERCGATVTKKELAQWYLKTTDFAQELLDGLDNVDWPERVKSLQRDWIGKSSGTLVRFEVPHKPSHFVLLHGFKSGSDKNFFPWIKEELEKRGHTVEVPNLPNPNSPTPLEQTEYVLKHCRLDENTIVLGHSLGAAVALKVVEQKKVKKLILVAGFLTPEFKDHPRPFENNFNWQFNLEKIRENVSDIVLLSDKHDVAVGAEHGRKIQKALNGRLVEVVAHLTHFTGSQEPDILSQLINQISVFTTRVDTIFGVNAVVLAPEHPLVADLTADEQSQAVNQYLKQAQSKTNIDREQNKEKTAVFLGSYAFHPLTGEKIPVWVADYVLMEYGTGAVMSVPAHDQRDYEFALKYQLPIKTVIIPRFIDQNNPYRENKKTSFRKIILGVVRDPKTGKYLALKWKKVPWTTFITGGIEDEESPVEAAKREIIEETGYQHIKHVKTAEMPVQDEFFATHKDVNRVAWTWFSLFELEDDVQNNLTAEEEETHELIWLDKSQLTREVFNHVEMPQLMEWIDSDSLDKLFSDQGVLINSDEFDRLTSQEAIVKITEELEKRRLGQAEVTYRLRDWLVSRQRYWGAPIPIVYDSEGNPHAVKGEHLPLLLPEDVDFLPSGESPIARSKEYIERAEKLYGKGWRFETDTLDTFVDSSWYYLRYLTPDDSKEPFSEGLVKKWLPVDLYIGGIEHATLHLLYARFITRFLARFNYIDKEITEPFKQLFNIGMITLHGAKMSKSKGNVVTPEEIVEHYGTDALRGYELFIGPMDVEAEWSTYGINGIHRFLLKIFHFYINFQENEEQSPNIKRIFNEYLIKVKPMIETFRLNTAISEAMKFLNEAEKTRMDRETAQSFLITLAPIFPFLSEELWEQLGHQTSIFKARWPEFLRVDQASEINVLINQKFVVAFSTSEKDGQRIIELAQELPDVKNRLGGKDFKPIYKTGKMVNFVVKP